MSALSLSCRSTSTYHTRIILKSLLGRNSHHLLHEAFERLQASAVDRECQTFGCFSVYQDT